MSVETEDTAEQYKSKLASEERSARVQHSLWKDHVVDDAEGEDGFIVGARWLWTTSNQQPADADEGKSLYLMLFLVLLLKYTAFSDFGFCYWFVV